MFLGIIIVAGLIVWGVGYYRYMQTPEYAVEKYYKELKAKYAADTYGGDTPEETLRLFIDALKKGDIELASKYFVVEEQEKWFKKIEEIKNKNVLNAMIQDLKNLKLTKSELQKVFYTLADEKKVVMVEMILVKNQNNKWKISEL